MSRMENKLQQVWGATALEFCKTCGIPTSVSQCTHGDAAGWAELDEQQRALVRWQAIQKAKADRFVVTVAS